MIRTADCLPLFFFDPETTAVGMAHAGWRGIKKGIISRMLEMFQKGFESSLSSLRVGIGPAICRSCYEVGEEFLNYFPGFVERSGEKYFCDLHGVVKKQLVDWGIKQENVFDSGFCTACSVDQFFSARREGRDTGRLISAILLK